MYYISTLLNILPAGCVNISRVWTFQMNVRDRSMAVGSPLAPLREAVKAYDSLPIGELFQLCRRPLSHWRGLIVLRACAWHENPLNIKAATLAES